MSTTLVPPTHPALWSPAARITDFASPAFTSLVADLRHVLTREQALGVAAPQLGVALAAFAWKDGQVITNPDYERLGGRGVPQVPCDEGCLTWPGQRTLVHRHHTVVAYWQDEAGKERTRVLIGLEARVFQHETDHCQGRCVFPKPTSIVTLDDTMNPSDHPDRYATP